MILAFHRETNAREFRELLTAQHYGGDRVRVLNGAGNVMLDCSVWPYEQTWRRGWFV